MTDDLINADRYYILSGHDPVVVRDIHQWARWFEKANRRVAQTDVDKYRVSTVFLALDHNFINAGPPILFETMVFEGNNLSECYMNRYSTWDQAEAGHKAVVDKLQKGVPVEALDD